MISENQEPIPKLLKDYVNYNINLNKSPNSIKEYKYDIVRFLKFIKGLSLRD